MTSEPAKEAYVWVWLPGQTEPVVAGVLRRSGSQFLFNYGQSYLARPEAIALYDPELPLRAGSLPLLTGLSMPSTLRDASPDAWGRRVLINRKLGLSDQQAAQQELDELTYLLDSGSDRVGALDFQASATTYLPRYSANASLDELLRSAEKVEQGVLLSPDLDLALQHGTALGGARPKALIDAGHKKYIAKFSTSNDLYNVVKAEFLAMRLAQLVGLNAAPVRLTRALGKDVLLIERFDRVTSNQGWCRKAMVSALTMLELDEMMARYASYENLAEIIRHRFVEPSQSLRELFGRMVFNILVGNTDDHARNHAAFWDGHRLALTPAYDICPQARSGQEASQAMLLHGNERASQLAVARVSAPAFLLNASATNGLINEQIAAIQQHWQQVCEEAELTQAERQFFWGRQFLNPFIFEG